MSFPAPHRRTLADLERTLVLAESRLPAEGGASDNSSFARQLLDELLATCKENPARPAEPVRLLAHFACTGGTLFSKCISAMPNVQLLSEVEPFADTYAPDPSPRFAPTDLIKRVAQGTRPVGDELTAELFTGAIDVVHRYCEGVGYRLVIREHSHTRYCRHSLGRERSSVQQLLSRQHRVLAILTVRHPVSSFLALQKQGWAHFRPATISEYVNRYMRFLDQSRKASIFRYEDLVDRPAEEMGRICDALELKYSPSFAEDFAHFAITGDSGRSRRRITRHPPREIDAATRKEIRTNCKPLKALCERLGYEDIAPA